MSILKIYFESARKTFCFPYTTPQPVLSTALKCSARMGNVLYPCHTHEFNIS